MPKIMDLQLLEDVDQATSGVWDIIAGKAQQSQRAMENRVASQESSLSDSLSPIFDAATSVLTGGIQNVMGGQSFFNPGTLFGPQPGAGSSATLVPGIHGGGGGGGGGSYTQGDPGSHWSGGPAGSTPLF